MSFLSKFQLAANKAGTQAQAFGTRALDNAETFAGSFALDKECNKAARTLQSFVADPENPQSALNSIPKAVLLRAKALAIFTVVKAGFVWSARAGSGVVIARLDDGSWSAPSCIATGGVGVGFQIGADMSEFVVVLNTDDAIQTFARAGNVTLGGNLQASVGPIGTGGGVDSSLIRPSPSFTYSKSKGLYAGVSLEGTALFERKEANATFYGQRVPAADILSGRIPAPEAAAALYSVVEAAESVDESNVPQQSFVPDRPLFDAQHD